MPKSSTSLDQVINETELESILSSSSSGIAAETYFTEDDGRKINLNTFRFKDGETILGFACINNSAIARHLLERFPILDVSLRNADQETALQIVISQNHVSEKLCKALLAKMLDKNMTVDDETLELAEDRKICSTGAPSVTGQAIYKLLVAHNKKLQQQEAAPAIAAAMPPSNPELIDLAVDDPEVQLIKSLEENLIQKKQALAARVEKGRTIKRKLEEFMPLFEDFKSKRLQLEKIKADISELTAGTSLEVFVSSNAPLVPGLFAAFNKTLLPNVPNYGNLIPAASEEQALDLEESDAEEFFSIGSLIPGFS